MVVEKNPDEVEIDVDDDDDEEDVGMQAKATNADEIMINDDEDEGGGEESGSVAANGDPAKSSLPGPGPPPSIDESVDRLAAMRTGKTPPPPSPPSATALGKRKAEDSPDRSDKVEANGEKMDVDPVTNFDGTASLPPTSSDADGQTGLETRFLALDKCLPGRGFLQVGAGVVSSDCDFASRKFSFCFHRFLTLNHLARLPDKEPLLHRVLTTPCSPRPHLRVP